MDIARPYYEIVPVLDPIKILTELESGNWVDNREATKSLIKKVLALLVSVKTINSDKHYYKEQIPQFNSFANLIKTLLSPLIESRYLEVSDDSRDLPTIIIHPNLGEAHEVLRLSQYCYEEENAHKQSSGHYIIFKQPFLYTHYDTVNPDEKSWLNGNPYQCVTNGSGPDVISGLGVNDMKGSVAAVILLLWYLAHKGIALNSVIFLSPNEEYKIKEDRKILGTIDSDAIKLDLEPTGTYSLGLANEITSSRSYGFKPDRYIKDFASKKTALICDIYNIVRKLRIAQITPDDIHISYSDKLYISIANIPDDVWKDDTEQELSEELVKCIAGAITDIFKIYVELVRDSIFQNTVSNISPKHSKILSSIRDDLPVRVYPVQDDHLTIFKPDPKSLFGKLMHNFNNSLSINLSNSDNMAVIGPAEYGARHTDTEAGNLEDLFDQFNFLVDVNIAYSQEIIEA